VERALGEVKEGAERGRVMGPKKVLRQGAVDDRVMRVEGADPARASKFGIRMQVFAVNVMKLVLQTGGLTKG
jgi:hypothetical protein